MKIKTFELERLQSLYENTVDYNLTESGFHPYALNELLSDNEQQKLLTLTLGYGQTNGAVSLRKQIASLYNCENENASNHIHTEINIKNIDKKYFRPKIFN